MKRPLLKYLIFSLMTVAGLQAEAVKPNAAISEMQELYRSKKWDHFFGQALYYRANQKNNQSENLDHVVAMELMALARHCQWATILKLKNNYSSKKQFVKTQKALAVIRMKQEFKNFQTDQKQKREGLFTSLRKSRSHWVIDVNAIHRLEKSDKIKVRVKSLCH